MCNFLKFKTHRLRLALCLLANILYVTSSVKIATINLDGCTNLLMSHNRVIKKVFNFAKSYFLLKFFIFKGHIILERKLLEEKEESDPGLAERTRPLTRASSSSSMSSSGISSVTIT